ncbi:BPSL0067 family protein [Falsiroseomonas stagni]|uniref:CHAP domain-containing protein n=1 Tax=Falsiroseomonas stagni DSM 19981 TaxID=1123062 RepID=A0A1I4B229_9PROT|nr:BPSL0067 family protein [Falsiroseomonas stagni]SFK62207.1 hypothetical protein SAMN02745775_104343 [Falsiroseomonas stagni DSM 19981]
MPFIATGYTKNVNAPVGKWVCTRTSALKPYDAVPPLAKRSGPDFCGQCVSFVTRACSTLPVSTAQWKKGALVKEATEIADGTVIATFNAQGRYEGHAAIFVKKDTQGIHVYDQWVTGTNPKAIGPRLIRWTGTGVSNRGDGFHVVEPL